MGRTKTRDDGVVYEPLLVRYTKPVNGTQLPLTLTEARTRLGPTVMPSPWVTAGWFWGYATPASARDIRRRGHRAVGTEVITFIPPQPGLNIDSDVLGYDETLIPVWGTPEHTAQMIEETNLRKETAA